MLTQSEAQNPELLRKEKQYFTASYYLLSLVYSTICENPFSFCVVFLNGKHVVMYSFFSPLSIKRVPEKYLLTNLTKLETKMIKMIILFVMVAVVAAEKYNMMHKADCDYQCRSYCERMGYGSWECQDQGGWFPKYSECHCWGLNNFLYGNE